MTSLIDSIWSYDELVKHVGLPPEGAKSVKSLLPGTPPEFLELVQYAAVWGIGDDTYREELVGDATEASRQNLKWMVDEYEDQLESWLAGPESEVADVSDAYVAFTCMVMASDSIVLNPPESI